MLIPTIVLARGGSYTFEVSQTGTVLDPKAQQGTSGTATHVKAMLQTREVFGVTQQRHRQRNNYIPCICSGCTGYPY